MGSLYLQEAFKALDMLTEEDFNANSTEDMSELKDFIENDDEDITFIDVIDSDATTEDELKDNYIGNIILDCEVCHTKQYRDPNDIKIDEETGLVDVGEECPYCYSSDGYTIIGEVVPYNGNKDKEDEDEIELDDSIDESYNSKYKNENLNEAWDSARVVDIVRYCYDRYYDLDKTFKVVKHQMQKEGSVLPESDKELKQSIYDAWDELEEYHSYDESLNKHRHKKALIKNENLIEGINNIESIVNDFADENAIIIPLTDKISDTFDVNLHTFNDGVPVLKDFDRGNTVEKEGILKKGTKGIYLENGDYIYFPFKDGWVRLDVDYLIRYNKIDKSALQDYIDLDDYDIEESLYESKKSWMSVAREQGYSFKELAKIFKDETGIDVSKDAGETGNGLKFSKWVKKYLGINESYKRKLREKKWSNTLKSGKALRKAIDSEDYDAIKEALINCYKEINELMPDVFDENDLESALDDIEILDTEPDADIDISMQDVEDNWNYELSNFYDLCDNLNIWISLDESFNSRRNRKIKEDFERVEIETEDQKMEMTSEDNGKIVVTSEPKDTDKEEVIAPVSAEIQDEINPIEDEDVDEVDIDIDEFSEDEFDNLGESYLKKVYENVNSFKTSSVRSKGNSLIIEGIIKFNSGKNKKTSFVFEAKDITKRGKIRFIGENLQISRGKKSFTLSGKLKGNKFISESLNYNYRAKDTNNISKRLYGTVKI